MGLKKRIIILFIISFFIVRLSWAQNSIKPAIYTSLNYSFTGAKYGLGIAAEHQDWSFFFGLADNFSVLSLSGERVFGTQVEFMYKVFERNSLTQGLALQHFWFNHNGNFYTNEINLLSELRWGINTHFVFTGAIGAGLGFYSYSSPQTSATVNIHPSAKIGIGYVF